MDLKDTPRPHVLIDMDCPQLRISSEDKKCDFVFISDHGSLVIPLELKSGRLDASEVLEQIQAGARFAEQFIPPTRRSVRLIPIAVVGGGVPRPELKQLRKKSSRVRFRGKLVSIKTLKSGQPLMKAIDGKID